MADAAWLDLGADGWLRVQAGGWAALVRDGLPNRVILRVQEDDRGAVRVVGLEIGDPNSAPRSSVSVRFLREIPLGKIEAALNRPGLVDGIREVIRHSAPGDVIQAEKQLFAHKVLLGELHDLEELERYRMPKRIKVPAGRKRPDEFYAQIADAHAFLRADGELRPAQVIAERANVPISTVYRWLKEARARGILPAARKEQR